MRSLSWLWPHLLSTITPDEPRSFNPEIGDELSAIVMGLIERKPAKRFRDAGVVIRVLKAVIE